MALHQAQKTIVSDNHRFRILVCGRKFGKTTLAAEEISGCAIAKSNQRVLYLSPTLEDSRRLMWDRLKKKLHGAILKTNDTRLELKVRTQDGGESDIFLGSWEKVQDYRGDEFDFIIPDETQDYKNFWVGWHEALRPTLTPRRGAALFMGTPKGYNHFYDLHNLELKDTDYKSFHFSSYDNPFIPKEEIEKAKNELSSERFSQEYLANFTKTEGLVYKEFDRKKHIFDAQQVNYHEVISGVDFGFTNPCAVYSIGVDHSGKYWIFDEFYKTHKTDSEVAEYVSGQGFAKVYPDPESPAAVEEMRRRGVNVREVVKGKDSIKNGIDRVRELLRAKQLFVSSSCVNLISEFETYSYPDKKDSHNESELPVDENNHALDAIRYALTMHSHREQFEKMTVYIPDDI